jgi:hypothetical protein
MGYKLWELANREGVVGLLPHVEEAVLRILEDQRVPTLTSRTPNDVGEPLARYFHATIMKLARPLRKSDPQPPDPLYTHITYPTDTAIRDAWGSLSSNRIMLQVSDNTLTHVQAQRLGHSIVNQLRWHRLLRTTTGTGHAAYWIRPWPENLKWENMPYQRIDPQTEKRILQEEAKAEATITISYSSKAIVGEVPTEIGPEWAAETISRLTRAYDVLALKYGETKGLYHQAKAEMEKLAEEMEAAKVDPTKAKWEEARERINKALSTNKALTS